MYFLHDAILEFNYDLITWLIPRVTDIDAPDPQGNTALVIAMKAGVYSSYSKRFSRRNASVTAINYAGCSALMVGLDHSRTYEVQWLLKRYRTIRRRPQNDVDRYWGGGRLALLLEIMLGGEKAVRELLESGVPVNAVNAVGETPLMFASEAGNKDAVRLLLKHGADPNMKADSDSPFAYNPGQTALHMAADEGHAGCARLLIEYGAAVNAQDKYGFTPLMSVAFYSSAPTCKVLLVNGADFNIETTDGSTALIRAAWLSKVEIIQMLLNHGAGANKDRLQEAFYACFTDNNSDKAPILIAAGARVGLPEAVLLQDDDKILGFLADGATQNDLNRALCYASARSSEEIVRLLLAHGANPNAKCGSDKKPTTPLHRSFAGPLRQPGVFEALVEAGADPNVRDWKGDTAHWMVHEWSNSCARNLTGVRLSIASGANVNDANAKGTTALMRAARYKDVASVEYLLTKGSAVDQQDKEGRTALWFAANMGCASVARLLVIHGADWDLVDHNGCSPRSRAERWIGNAMARLAGRNQ